MQSDDASWINDVTKHRLILFFCARRTNESVTVFGGSSPSLSLTLYARVTNTMIYKERKRESSRWPRDSTRIKESALNLRNPRTKVREWTEDRRGKGIGLSGVVVVTATAATAAVVAAESAGAAFWVSGFVPRPLTLVRPRNPQSPPPLPPLRPHEVRKGCCARGARMWNSRSAHSVTPACRGLSFLGACTLMRYVRPNRPNPSYPGSPVPTFERSRHPTSSSLLLAFPLASPLAIGPASFIPRPIAFYRRGKFTRFNSNNRSSSRKREKDIIFYT